MSPERINRNQALINFVREEEKRIEAGEQVKPTTRKDLVRLFGYNPRSGHLSQVLKEAGINREARRGTKEKDCTIPSSSRDLSYFIGLLAASGTFSNRMTDFSVNRISEENKEILYVFKTLGETLFQINANVRSKEKVVRSYKYKDEYVIFNSTKAFQFLGNLGKSRWPQTILEKHSWIFTNQDYLWGLLEGYFDGSGGIYEGQGNRVVLRSSSRNDCLFLLQLLVAVGIKEPKLQTLSRAKEGVSGVVLCVIEDARTFAQNIHSKMPKKEAVLDYYRTRQNRQKLKRISDNELINEYAKVRKILDHPPSYLEMLKLHKEGITRFNMSTYSERFGDESFIKAREYLEDILLKRSNGEDINEFLKSYEQKSGIQIRYVPKLHRLSDDKAKRRLEEILSEKATEPVFAPTLIGTSGQTLIPSPKQIEYIDRLNAEDIERNEIEPGVEIPSTLKSKGIPISVLKIGETFNNLGYVGRRIFYLLAQSKEPISSSQLARAIYGDEIDLTIARQRIRMCIYKTLNPGLTEKGYAVFNVGESKTHWEALYNLTEPEMIQSSNLPYEQLMRWNEMDDMFEVNLPDEQIFKVKDMLKAKLVAMLIHTGELSMDTLTGEFFGSYNPRASDNVGHLVRRTRRLLEQLGWSIPQTTTPRELRLGQKAKYSLVDK